VLRKLLDDPSRAHLTAGLPHGFGERSGKLVLHVAVGTPPLRPAPHMKVDGGPTGLPKIMSTQAAEKGR
jgi:hypothetical protein